MPSSIWSGYLTFGMISIPVKLFPAARSESLGFHMLHKNCGSRVKQQLYCPVHEETISRSDTVKGYEYEKNRYVEIEPEEVKKIEPRTARAMEILEFVAADEVDPLYFENSYFLVPDEPGRRAYVLLRQALADRKKLAVAKVSMHNREYTVIVRPLEKGLAVHSMFYENEVRSIQDAGNVDGLEVKEKELELATSLVESLSASFEPEKFHDTFQDNLRKLVEAKLEGQPVEEVQKPKLAPVIDLMAALKKSLEEARKVPRKHAATAARAESEEEAREETRQQRKSARRRSA